MGETACPQSKRLIWHFNAVDCLGNRALCGALRAQRLELYSLLSRHHQRGDDVLREVPDELACAFAGLSQLRPVEILGRLYA